MATLQTHAGGSLETRDTPPRRGGESAVYDATGPAGPCVVKVALDPLPFGAWLERERALLADLGADPATADLVPRVLGHGIWDGRPFVALERFAETLETQIGGTPSPAARLALAERVALLVERLHRARPDLVHRDLKPSNFLADGDRLVLTDFGIARENSGRQSTTTRALYTADYAAPEQALPHRQVDPSWDEFGLAATIFHVLVGEPPTAPGTNAWRRTPRGLLLRAGKDEGRDDAAIYLDFRAMEPLSRSDLARLDAVVRGPIRRGLLAALAPDPRRRRGSAASLAEALRATRARRQRPRWPAAIGVAGLAAGWMGWSLTPSPPNYPEVEIPAGPETEAFLLGEFEVTQAQWRDTLGDGLETRRIFDAQGLGASCALYGRVSLAGPENPMVCVSFLDAVRFANALSARAGLVPAYRVTEAPETGASSVAWDRAADGWRLPTAAEWDHAAGSGDPTPCAENRADRSYLAEFPESNADDCDDRWPGLSPVGHFPAGSHGLRDASGNASEWLWDGDARQRQVTRDSWAGPRSALPALDAQHRDANGRFLTVGLRLARRR